MWGVTTYVLTCECGAVKTTEVLGQQVGAMNPPTTLEFRNRHPNILRSHIDAKIEPCDKRTKS